MQLATWGIVEPNSPWQPTTAPYTAGVSTNAVTYPPDAQSQESEAADILQIERASPLR
jgi:hypothetical protein